MLLEYIDALPLDSGCISKCSEERHSQLIYYVFLCNDAVTLFTDDEYSARSTSNAMLRCLAA